MLVIDASVVVKWFFPEVDSDKAERFLLSKEKLVAPEIIRIEVASAITRLLRMKNIDLETATLLLSDWREYLLEETVSLEPTLLDFDRATQIAMDINHQLQDCLYVAAAMRLNVPLLTADEKLLKKSDKIPCEFKTL